DLTVPRPLSTTATATSPTYALSLHDALPISLLVRGTEEYRRARPGEDLISLPTGDGMALTFLNEPEAPVQCALEIAASLRDRPQDRKSTRLNSSHLGISYAVFCLKKKNNYIEAVLDTHRRSLLSKALFCQRAPALGHALALVGIAIPHLLQRGSRALLYARDRAIV